MALNDLRKALELSLAKERSLRNQFRTMYRAIGEHSADAESREDMRHFDRLGLKFDQATTLLNELKVALDTSANLFSVFLTDYGKQIHVQRKQLSEIIVGHCSGYYHCNRSSYDELKELLEAGL